MDDEYVEVTTRRLALKSPNFLVQFEGRIYYTMASLEYDPKARELTAQQLRDIKKVQKIFESAKAKVPAVVVTDTQQWKHQSSQPVLPKGPRPKLDELKATVVKEAKAKGTKVKGTKVRGTKG